MAIAQTDVQRTSPPYALIVFAVLTVLLAAVAVWMYIKWDKSKKELADLQSQQNSLLSKVQSRDQAYQDVMAEALKVEGSPSVVAYLLGERSKLRSQLVSDPNLSSADIQGEIDAAVEAAQEQLKDDPAASLFGLPLAEVIKSMSASYAAQLQATAAAKARASSAEGLAQQSQERLQTVQESASKNLADLRSEVQARWNTLDEYLKAWTGHLEQLQANLNTLRESGRTEKDVAEQKIKAMQTDLTENKKRLQSLIEKVQQWRTEGGINFTGMVNRADGKIITVVPGQDIVLIDIGEGEHLPLSLQFEVFSSGEILTETSKSKATIQVVRVRETLSECQVVRMAKHQAILPDDLIVNSVYDRQNQYIFRVIGGFDVDGNGKPEVGGAQSVESLIQRWGGQVVSDLNVQTDYLVVGCEPQVPAEPDAFDQAAVSLYEQRRKERGAYMQEQDRAMDLSIPMLNHKRFLYLMGLGDRSELELLSPAQ